MDGKDKIMNANDYRIKWILNWDERYGWPACYNVSPSQKLERSKLRDGTSDVLNRIHLHHTKGKGWYLSFGFDYHPCSRIVTNWNRRVEKCWQELQILGVSETTMKLIEYDICGEDTYSYRAPVMLEYFRELCRAQAENPDKPRI